MESRNICDHMDKKMSLTPCYFNSLFRSGCKCSKPVCLCDFSKLLCSKKTPEHIDELKNVKEKLNTTKSKLDTINIDDWKRHTRTTQLADATPHCVRREVSDSDNQPLEMVTGAWCKMFEMLKLYNLLPMNPNKLRTAHLCECPGAFICATNAFVRLNYPLCDWDWKATSLNPYSEFNDPQAMIDDDNFYRETFHHWWRGADNTGNILHRENYENVFQWVRSDFENRAFDLVTADGSIDSQFDANEQESITASLHMAEFIWAVSILKLGGNLCLKGFTLFEQHSMTLLFLMSTNFEEVEVVKPFLSKAGNSETYLLGKGFKGISSALLKALVSTIGKPLDEQPLIPVRMVKEKFSDFFNSYINTATFFARLQTEAILRNLSLFTSKTPIDVKNFRNLKDQLAVDWVTNMGLDQARNKLSVTYRLVQEARLSARSYLSGGQNNSTRSTKRHRVGGIQSDRLNAHLDHKDLIQMRQLAGEEGDEIGSVSSKALPKHMAAKTVRLRLRDGNETIEEDEALLTLETVDVSNVKLSHKIERSHAEDGDDDDKSDPSKRAKVSSESNTEGDFNNSYSYNQSNEPNNMLKDENNLKTEISTSAGGQYGIKGSYGGSVMSNNYDFSSYNGFGDEEEEENAFSGVGSGYNPQPSSSTYGNTSSEKAAAAAASISEKKVPSWMRFGTKLLSKMGFVQGQGLGAEGQGIKVPLQLEHLGYNKEKVGAGLNTLHKQNVLEGTLLPEHVGIVKPKTILMPLFNGFYVSQHDVHKGNRQYNPVSASSLPSEFDKELHRFSNNRDGIMAVEWIRLINRELMHDGLKVAREGGWIEFSVLPRPHYDFLTTRFLTFPERDIETALKLRFRLLNRLPAVQLGDVLIRETAKYVRSPLDATLANTCPPVWSVALAEILMRIESNKYKASCFLEVNSGPIPWCAWLLKRRRTCGFVLFKHSVAMRTNIHDKLYGGGDIGANVWDASMIKDEKLIHKCRDVCREWKLSAALHDRTARNRINLCTLDCTTPPSANDYDSFIGSSRELIATELENVPTLIAGLYPCLSYLVVGGACVVRLPNSLTRVTAGIIGVLCSLFESVSLMRPQCIPGWTMERALVCTNFMCHFADLSENEQNNQRNQILKYFSQLTDFIRTNNKGRIEQILHPLLYTGLPFATWLCDANDDLIHHEIRDLESRINTEEIYPAVKNEGQSNWRTYLKPMLMQNPLFSHCLWTEDADNHSAQVQNFAEKLLGVTNENENNNNSKFEDIFGFFAPLSMENTAPQSSEVEERPDDEPEEDIDHHDVHENKNDFLTAMRKQGSEANEISTETNETKADEEADEESDSSDSDDAANFF